MHRPARLPILHSRSNPTPGSPSTHPPIRLLTLSNQIIQGYNTHSTIQISRITYNIIQLFFSYKPTGNG